jgi:hypothetical protein
MMRISEAIFSMVLLVVLWSFYRAHKDPRFHFNAFDLLLGEDGRVSKSAVVLLGAFATMSWAFIRLTIDGKMSEGLFLAYGATWVAPFITLVFSRKPVKDDPGASNPPQ